MEIKINNLLLKTHLYMCEFLQGILKYLLCCNCVKMLTENKKKMKLNEMFS